LFVITPQAPAGLPWTKVFGRPKKPWPFAPRKPDQALTVKTLAFGPTVEKMAIVG